MRPVAFQPKTIVQIFRTHKVLTKEEALRACGCKTMTLWKALRAHGYLTSYNCNATYYTLSDIPAFDEWGLWAYREARFSQWGSLSRTVDQLIERSPTGHTAKDLSALLGINVAPELSRLHRLRRVQREKVGSTFVYVASDHQQQQAQVMARRVELERAAEQARLPPPEVMIAVLVELVHHPGAPVHTLGRRLRRRRVPITDQDVRKIMAQYDLEPKRGL